MHTYFVSTIRNLAIPKGRADDDGIRAEAVEGEYYYIDTNKNGQISSTPTHFETVTTLHLLGNMYNNIISSAPSPAACQLNPINIIHITTDPRNKRCNDRKSIPV